MVLFVVSDEFYFLGGSGVIYVPLPGAGLVVKAYAALLKSC